MVEDYTIAMRRLPPFSGKLEAEEGDERPSRELVGRTEILCSRRRKVGAGE